MDRARAVMDRAGRGAVGRLWLGRWLCLAALLCGAAAQAHQDEYPKRDRLELQRDQVTLEVDYAVPAGDAAQALRRIFDRDRSGELDAAEAAQLRRHLVAEATHFAALELDGQALPLREETPAPEPAAPGAASAAVIDREARSAAVIDREARSAAVIDREARSAAVIDRLEVRVRLTARVSLVGHRLVLRDRHKDRRQRVPVTIRAAAGLRVRRGGPPLPLLGDGTALELRVE